jgi:hypothetical protein
MGRRDGVTPFTGLGSAGHCFVRPGNTFAPDTVYLLLSPPLNATSAVCPCVLLALSFALVLSLVLASSIWRLNLFVNVGLKQSLHAKTIVRENCVCWQDFTLARRNTHEQYGESRTTMLGLFSQRRHLVSLDLAGLRTFFTRKAEPRKVSL